MTDRIDYQALLRKYIEWVDECEGVNYIGEGLHHGNPEAHFGPDGWAELRRIDEELEAERKRAHEAWLASRKEGGR